MKKIYLTVLTVAILTSCSSSNGEIVLSSEEAVMNESITVSASIVPIASLINTIGGEYVDVNTIIPPGVSPHGYDLSIGQMQGISDSDIVFLIGSDDIDGFLEKADTSAPKFPLIEGLTLLSSERHDHSEHEDEDEHSDDFEDEDQHEDEHSIDPHVWLGKENAINISMKIRDQLSVILPEQATYFAQNTAAFQTELETAYTDFAQTIAEEEAKEFIVFHDAYNYLLESANIDQDKKIVFSSNTLQEIGTAHMSELINEIELHGVKNIFSEPQFSNENISDFAAEYDLTVGIIDPVGTDETSGGYINNLKSNLQALQTIYE